jgi:hypothetical protein
MLPPEAYERAVREAELLLQISIESVAIEDLHAAVAGHVICVFRGPRTMTGRRMALRVPIVLDEKAGRPGGVAYTRADHLIVGRILEAYVHEDASGPQVVLGICAVLDSPTQRSVLEERLQPSASPARAVLRFWVLGLLAALLLVAVFFSMR